MNMLPLSAYQAKLLGKEDLADLLTSPELLDYLSTQGGVRLCNLKKFPMDKGERYATDLVLHTSPTSYNVSLSLSVELGGTMCDTVELFDSCSPTSLKHGLVRMVLEMEVPGLTARVWEAYYPAMYRALREEDPGTLVARQQGTKNRLEEELIKEVLERHWGPSCTT